MDYMIRNHIYNKKLCIRQNISILSRLKPIIININKSNLEFLQICQAIREISKRLTYYKADKRPLAIEIQSARQRNRNQKRNIR